MVYKNGFDRCQGKENNNNYGVTMETPNWNDYVNEKPVQNEEPKQKQTLEQILDNKQEQIITKDGRIVGIKTGRPYPMRYIRIENYTTSANLNRDTYYAFDERGETWGYSTNEKDILTAIDNWMKATKQQAFQEQKPNQNPNGEK